MCRSWRLKPGDPQGNLPPSAAVARALTPPTTWGASPLASEAVGSWPSTFLSSPSGPVTLRTGEGTGQVPGSLRAKQPILSPLVKGVTHFCFCSLEPNFKMGPR